MKITEDIENYNTAGTGGLGGLSPGVPGWLDFDQDVRISLILAAKFFLENGF